MRFVLFTDKPVAQCMRALNDRLQAKGTKSRPELEGWIEKGGRFSLAVTSPVARRLSRKTRLNGDMTRDGSTTVIRGYVPDGVGPAGMRLLMIAWVVVFVALVVTDNPMVAFVLLLAGAMAYVPLHGDYVNSEILLIEVERTLGASPRPPKK